MGNLNVGLHVMEEDNVFRKLISQNRSKLGFSA